MASLKKKTNAPHKTKENGTNKHFEEDMDESDTTESDVSSDEEPMEPQEVDPIIFLYSLDLDLQLLLRVRLVTRV